MAVCGLSWVAWSRGGSLWSVLGGLEQGGSQWYVLGGLEQGDSLWYVLSSMEQGRMSLTCLYLHVQSVVHSGSVRTAGSQWWVSQ